MTWRVVSISHRSKLDYKMGYLEIRQGNSFSKVHLSEIATIIIESTAVSLTTYLINESIAKKINVLFCDEKHLPSSVLAPLYGSYDSSFKVKKQVEWASSLKSEIWQSIVTEKILNQAKVLASFGHELTAIQLVGYSDEVMLGDASNREGFAAKVYFNSLLGQDFSRNLDSFTNSALNYGYSILMSAFARAIYSCGCITQLGIWHRGASNNFNFACDLMEPFRPVIDLEVIGCKFNSFDKEEKRAIKNILNKELLFEGQKQYLNNIIPSYTRSVIDSLNSNDISYKRIFLL